MPGGDRTGPLGFGPATGRGLGYCTGFGFRVPGFGGMGRGMGAGMGRMANRFGFGVSSQPYAPNYSSAPNREAEKTYLKNQEQYLKEELKQVQAALSESDQES